MLENIMLIALGFLIATLFSLIAIQLVWRRAVKVTTRDLSNNLDLDDMRSQAARASTLDVTLREKHSEIITLSDKNTQLEETLANTHREVDTLSQDIASLQASYTNARVEAETHLHNLTLLHARIDELEAAARSDMEKRSHTEDQLKSLCEKALQLVADMNAVVADFNDIAPEPLAIPTRPGISKSLKSFLADETDDKDSAELPDLTKIKASLSELNDTEFSSDQHEKGTENAEAPPYTTEGYLADRIRVLKAGISTPT